MVAHYFAPTTYPYRNPFWLSDGFFMLISQPIWSDHKLVNRWPSEKDAASLPVAISKWQYHLFYATGTSLALNQQRII